MVTEPPGSLHKLRDAVWEAFKFYDHELAVKVCRLPRVICGTSRSLMPPASNTLERCGCGPEWDMQDEHTWNSA